MTALSLLLWFFLCLCVRLLTAPGAESDDAIAIIAYAKNPGAPPLLALLACLACTQYTGAPALYPERIDGGRIQVYLNDRELSSSLPSPTPDQSIRQALHHIFNNAAAASRHGGGSGRPGLRPCTTAAAGPDGVVGSTTRTAAASVPLRVGGYASREMHPPPSPHTRPPLQQSATRRNPTHSTYAHRLGSGAGSSTKVTDRKRAPVPPRPPMKPGRVSPRRPVPAHVPKPAYADTGKLPPASPVRSRSNAGGWCAWRG